ncbi:MAG: hypothetical protein LBE38_01850 [Deltaproteobacteria bacterium]|jgi:hypothetical protein|nr:hypothetical protein [Deltaproteobacteria bacterium]
MEPYQGNYPPPEDPGGYSSENLVVVEAPEFRDIFRHSWPVLWEKPKAVLVFVLFLTLLQFAESYISDLLVEPYSETINAMLTAPDMEKVQVQETFSKLIDQYGSWRLLIAAILPFLLLPLISYSCSRAALSMWDGYAPSLTDFTAAFFGYFKALLLTICLLVYCFVLGFISSLMTLPALVIYNLTGSNFLALIILTILTIFLWIRFMWPLVRRFLFLQFFVYFRFVDYPGEPGFFRQALAIHKELGLWPRHLNSMFGYACLIVIGVFIPMTILNIILESFVPVEVIYIIDYFVFTLAYLWMVLAASGFYRLCLNPINPVDQVNPAKISLEKTNAPS